MFAHKMFSIFFFSFFLLQSLLLSHSLSHSNSTFATTIYIFATLEFMYKVHLNLRQYWLAIRPFIALHWIAVTQLDFDKKKEKKVFQNLIRFLFFSSTRCCCFLLTYSLFLFDKISVVMPAATFRMPLKFPVVLHSYGVNIFSFRLISSWIFFVVLSEIAFA